MSKIVVTSPEVIKDKEFDGGAVLTPDDWSIFVVEHFEDLGTIFLNEWQDTAGILLTGSLSEDNTKIEKLNWVSVGKIFHSSPAVVSAARIWNFKEKDLFLTIKTIDLKKFKFESKMYSDFLDSGDIPFGWIDDKDNVQPLLPLVQQGFDGFCLRMVVEPDSTYSAKVHVFLYPHSKETLLENFKMSKRIEFPAVLIFSGTAEMGPQQAGFILDKNTGCPVIPAIKVINKLVEGGSCPTAGELSWKVSALFTSVVLPESRTRAQTLWTRMKVVEREGARQLRGAPPARIWPDSAMPVDNRSK